MINAETLQPISPRRVEDAAAMAVAVQANLVALRVAWERRSSAGPDGPGIRTPPPGAVQRFREVLIDRRVVQAYSDAELMLRTRQCWGEFALMCWNFEVIDPHDPPDFAREAAAGPRRCPGSLLAKEGQIARTLWRLRFEQRMRVETDASRQPGFQQDFDLAQSIPVRIHGIDLRLCTLPMLVESACEHAGMLGAVRWLIDDRRRWGEPGIMELAQEVQVCAAGEGGCCEGPPG